MSTNQPEGSKHFQPKIKALLTALLALTFAACLLPGAVQAKSSHAADPVRMPGLKSTAKIVREGKKLTPSQRGDFGPQITYGIMK